MIVGQMGGSRGARGLEGGSRSRREKCGKQEEIRPREDSGPRVSDVVGIGLTR